MSNYFKKVWIIDDNKIDRWRLKKSLARAELAQEIVEVENGMEALDLLTSYPKKETNLPDLIFLDMDMPVLSGTEFLNVFNQVTDLRDRNCRVIITCSVYDFIEKKR